MRSIRFVAGAALLVTAGSAAASPAPAGALPGPLTDLIACRAVADDAGRLACFDRTAAALAAAAARRDVVVVDRAEIGRARRSLFGFTLPSLRLLGGGRDDADEPIDEVEGVVAGARGDADGRWLIVLADGARWRQIDDRPLVLAPRAGTKVVTRRAALGSYVMRVGNQPGIKVRREQ